MSSSLQRGDSDPMNLIRLVVAEEASGFTLLTSEPPVLHTRDGSRVLDWSGISSESVASLLQRLLDSRQLREFRDRGVIRFFFTFERVRFVGGARREAERLRVELRRLVGC